MAGVVKDQPEDLILARANLTHTISLRWSSSPWYTILIIFFFQYVLLYTPYSISGVVVLDKSWNIMKSRKVRQYPHAFFMTLAVDSDDRPIQTTPCILPWHANVQLLVGSQASNRGAKRASTTRQKGGNQRECYARKMAANPFLKSSVRTRCAERLYPLWHLQQLSVSERFFFFYLSYPFFRPRFFFSMYLTRSLRYIVTCIVTTELWERTHVAWRE